MAIEFTVRPAKERDYNMICRLLTAEFIHNSYSDEDIHNLKGTQYDPEAVANKILKAHCWLAEFSGRAVGIATTKDLSGGVFIYKNFRGIGIGKALAQARTEFLKQHGEKEAIAHIEAFNTASINTFKSLGYQFNEESIRLIEEAKRAGIEREDMKDEKGRPPILTMTLSL